jgi:hypothetical protein
MAKTRPVQRVSPAMTTATFARYRRIALQHPHRSCPVSATSRFHNAVEYGVDPDGDGHLGIGGAVVVAPALANSGDSPGGGKISGELFGPP